MLIYYYFWGGFSWEGLYGPYASEEELISSYMWRQNHTYFIYAKAKDIYRAESDWTILEVKMGPGKAIISPLLGFLEQHPLLFQILRQILDL